MVGFIELEISFYVLLLDICGGFVTVSFYAAVGAVELVVFELYVMSDMKVYSSPVRLKFKVEPSVKLNFDGWFITIYESFLLFVLFKGLYIVTFHCPVFES